VTKGNTHIGKVTSAVYSPRLDQNIALAIVSIEYSEIGTELTVEINSKSVDAKVVEKPFYDPKKSIAAKTKI
jgi:aminomethyltransferase